MNTAEGQLQTQSRSAREAGTRRRGLPHHRRTARGRGRDPHQAGRVHDHLGGAARARRRARRRARQARLEARPDARADAVEPPGVPPLRPRGDDARGDAVLDLQHLHRASRSATCSRMPTRRSSSASSSSCRGARGSRAPAGARARDRRRWRCARRHARAGAGRGLQSGLRRRSLGRAAAADRRAHADLHLRHHRPAQGRPADPPQSARLGRGPGRVDQLSAGRTRDLVAAGSAHRRAQRTSLSADRVRSADHLLR